MQFSCSRSKPFYVGAMFLLCLGGPRVRLRAQEARTGTIEVRGNPVASPTPSHDDHRAKLNHIMREVNETQITVTKKATVIKLEQQPPVQNNNMQELFSRAPGLVVSEQQNPGQFNYS